MNASEILAIKNYQRDFEKRFGKKLEVDWYAMKNIKRLSFNEDIPTAQQLLDEALEKFGASLDVIKNGRRLFMSSDANERKALEYYCKKVAYYQLDYKSSAKLINRDRSIIYYYEKCV